MHVCVRAVRLRSYPSRYLTASGSWQQHRFAEPTSDRRLEEYAAAAEERRSLSPLSMAADQDDSRSSKTVSKSKSTGGNGSTRRRRSRKSYGGNTHGIGHGHGHGHGAVHSSASAPDISAGARSSSGSFPPIHQQQSQPQSGRSVTPSFGLADRTTTPQTQTQTQQAPSPSSSTAAGGAAGGRSAAAGVSGRVRGRTSLSPEPSDRTGRYGGSSWFQRTRPNWYGLDSRTQQAF
jgi:hypothetical protein